MTFTIALAQCARPADGDVVANVRRWTARAADEGARLVVFPEALMTRYDGSPEAFAACAQPADGPFARSIDAIAREFGVWIGYTMNERNPGGGSDPADGSDSTGGRPFNTAVITDDEGRQRARYRKVHLFDAQGYRESDYMAAGERLLQPVHTPFATIGCGICFDLRFPDVAREAALSGAQVMLYPSAWVAGPLKIDQWETLLRARAIECGMFVAGVSSVDENRIGHSCVFAPDGAPLAIGPDGVEALVMAELDIAEVERMRSITPTLIPPR